MLAAHDKAATQQISQELDQAPYQEPGHDSRGLDCAVVASPVRRARARHSSAGNEGAVLLSVLLEFWLSDGDQPLPPGPSQDVLAGMSSAARQNSLDGWTFAAAGG